MASNNESTEAIATKESELNAPPKRVNCFNTLFILITCLALITAGYSYYTVYQLQQNARQYNRSINASLNQLIQQQASIQEKNSETMNRLNKTNALTQDRLKQLDEQIERMSNQKSTSQDWLLLKARHYIELAQINAHWNSHFNDASTPLLLEQADLILAEMNSVKLFKIREILAKEILETKALQQKDIPGIISQLEAIQQKVEALNLSALPVEEKSSEASIQPEASWKLHFKNSLDVLKQLIIIHHTEENIAPMLSPLLESLFKESLRLNLQEAQWAVINANPKVYALVLTQASNTLKKYGATYPDASFLLQQINALSVIDVAPKPLSIGKALPLLNALINAKQNDKNKDTPLEKTGE